MMNVYESIMAGLEESLEYTKGERSDLKTVVMETKQSDDNKGSSMPVTNIVDDSCC